MCSVGDCLTTIYSLLHVLQARQCTLLAPHGKAQYSKADEPMRGISIFELY